MTNINPDTGIAYGYISANALHGDIVDELQMNGEDPHYAGAMKEAQREFARNKDVQAEMAAEEELTLSDHDEDYAFENTLAWLVENWEGSKYEQRFNDDYQPDEPIHEGTKDGVKYRTSWLGGALNVWVFESPYTGHFDACSPCVPGAANLDCPNPDGIEGYDVPPDWRDWRDSRG